MGLKTYDYIVTLKPNVNYKAVDLISQLLIFIAIIISVYVTVSLNGWRNQLIPGLLALVLIAGWVFTRITKGKYSKTLLVAGIALLLAARSLEMYPQGVWALVAYAVAGILEWQIKFKQEIGFDEEGIAINSFPKKKYEWHEVSNVVLKDDIITVDLYNNKIIQREIDSEIDEETEKEFNHFCRSHLLSV